MKPRRPWYFVIQPQRSKTPKHPKFNAFWGPKQSGATCVLNLAAHGSYSAILPSCHYPPKPGFSFPPYVPLVLIPIFLLGYTISSHWPRDPSTAQRHSLRGFFFFLNAISPLMVPRQAASQMNYKLSVFMWECSHQKKRPRFPCLLLKLEGQKPCMEAPKAPYRG